MSLEIKNKLHQNFRNEMTKFYMTLGEFNQSGREAIINKYTNSEIKYIFEPPHRLGGKKSRRHNCKRRFHTKFSRVK